jgi:hypothetical protein
LEPRAARQTIPPNCAKATVGDRYPYDLATFSIRNRGLFADFIDQLLQICAELSIDVAQT